MPRGKPDGLLDGRPALRNITPADGLPPHSVAAEEATIAALMLDGRAIDRCMSVKLKSEDFFREQNGWVYEACQDLVIDGQEITIQSVAHRLNVAGKLDMSGGEPYLAEIVGKYFTAIGVETHAEIVKNASRLRQTIAAAGQIAQIAYEGGEAKEVLDTSLNLLTGLAVETSGNGLEQMGYGNLEQPTGYEWGFPVLDRFTMGVVKGQMGILAGPSGQGKSFAAAQIARHVASQGGKVAIFTLEMSAKEYEARMAHAIAGVRKRYSRYEAPLTETEQARVVEAQRMIWDWGIQISDKASVSAINVGSSSKLLKAESGLDLLVIDYLGLLERRDDDNEAASLKATTKYLKNVSMDLGCFTLLLSQMNRAGLNETRLANSGSMNCLVTGEKVGLPFKESLMGGAVENDADLVVMLQRHTKCLDFGHHHMEVVIDKNRNGVNGHSMVYDEFQLCRFRTMSQEEITSTAHGNMEMYHKLQIDQGWYQE